MVTPENTGGESEQDRPSPGGHDAAPAAGLAPGEPPPEAPGGEGPPPVPSRRSRLAIAALATGLLGLVPIAIGFGIAALVQVRRRAHKGKGLAIGGLVAALAWAAAWGVFVAVVVPAFSADPDEPGAAVEAGTVHVSALRVGDCYDDGFGTDDTDLTLVKAVPCDEPHRGEIVVRVPAAAPDGGTATLDQADAMCREKSEHLARSSLSKALDLYVFMPEKDGEQSIGCALFHSGGKITTNLAETVDDDVKRYDDLRPGECVEEIRWWYDVTTWAASHAKTVACTEPHFDQVYAAFDLPYENGDRGKVPDNAYLKKESERRCDELLWESIDAEAGVEYGFRPVGPTRESWQDSRTVVCLVGLPGGPLEKSIVPD